MSARLLKLQRHAMLAIIAGCIIGLVFGLANFLAN